MFERWSVDDCSKFKKHAESLHLHTLGQVLVDAPATHCSSSEAHQTPTPSQTCGALLSASIGPTTPLLNVHSWQQLPAHVDSVGTLVQAT